MKTKHEFILSLVATSMLVLAIQSNAVSAAGSNHPTKIGSAASTQPAVSLKISGTIKNFDAFVTHVLPETYIQLVPLAANGLVTTIIRFQDGKGHPYFDSDLLKLSVPKKAAFRFDVPNIQPGRYFLAAQRSNLFFAQASEGPVFLTDKEVMFIIDVPADAKSPFTIKAGDLIVRLHQPRW